MSKKIDKKAILHIARLSRIELDESRLDSHSQQLGRIVEYFDKLNELDTDKVEPLTHAVELSNILAVDEVGSSLSTEEALANAPEQEGSFFKVPKVLGDS
jgi:aspartyl-tRNA(Asn)/glutamyl-tRNA(Gln) amidotransferase subunit C